MVRQCSVCGNLFDTTKTGRYRYCSERCAKSRNNNNHPRDLSTFRLNEPAQVELVGDGYDPDGNLVYDYAQCPNCQRAFEESDENWECGYCPCCGQALNWWGDEEGESTN